MKTLQEFVELKKQLENEIFDPETTKARRDELVSGLAVINWAIADEPSLFPGVRLHSHSDE
jgi:hypothetical protein